MSKYGSPDLKIEVDSKDLSQYVLENVDLTVEGLTEEVQGFGKSWVEHASTKIKQGNEFTISGLYDDTAVSGPNAVLNNVGAEVPVVITWGGTKKSTLDAIIKSYTRTAVRGELHKFSATMLPSGEVSEA